MPLVRIDFFEGYPDDFGSRVAQIVYRTMMAEFGVPEHDNFQVVNEHRPGGIVFDHEYLGIERTTGIVIVQITLNAGRSVEKKQAFYAALAAGLSAELSVRPEDLLISLVEVAKENWSFGNGVAQYV
ncbi:MAG: tautomerase family protein [Actinomycetales bacterium]